jgi:hypothetical protein
MSNRELDLYLAGDYMFPYKNSSTDIYLLGYNRLLSYDYQRKLVDKLIERKKIMQLYLAGAEKFGEEERKSYMDLYLAGSEGEPQTTTDELMPSNFLFSYANQQTRTMKTLDMSHLAGAKLFIDSGAFSMWTKGVSIDVDEYIKWLNERSEYIDLFGQVDAIPPVNASPQQVREAAEKTWENYLYMRARVNKPEGLLYTFHVGEPIEFLERALRWKDENGNYIPYIALGGMVGKTHNVRDNFLRQCYDAIKRSPNPNVKVHAFGMTDRDLAEKYPITSADSTSWIMVGAVGGIITDVGTVNVSSKQVNLPNHYSHLPKEAIESFNKTIEEFGFTLDELAEDRNKRLIHNARYMKKKFSEIEYKPQVRKRALF